MNEEEKRVYIREYLRKRREKAIAIGMCSHCQKRPIKTTALCEMCLEKHRLKSKFYYWRKKRFAPPRVKKPTKAEIQAAKEFEATARIERMLKLAARPGERAIA